MSDETVGALEYLRMLVDERDARYFAALDAHDHRDIDRHRTLEQLLEERARRWEQRFTAQEHAVANALESSEKAVTKAELATEKRFDAVNEFRAQLADQAATLMPRAEAQVLLTGVTDKIAELASRQLTLTERFISKDTYESGHIDLAHRIDSLAKDVSALQLSLSANVAGAVGGQEAEARNARTFGLLIAAGALLAAIAAVVVSRL